MKAFGRFMHGSPGMGDLIFWSVVWVMCVTMIPAPPLTAGNAPPPQEIPWDSIWVTETQTFTDRGGKERTRETGGRWQYFITKERYEELVWGPTKGGQVDQFKKDLEQLKETLKKGDK